MPSKVVHVRHADYDVYIGRKNGDLPQSKWANPFVIGVDGNRDEVLAKYREWISTQKHLMDALPELEGKVLGCWCHPKPCHGNILLDLLSKDGILDY